MNKQVDLIWLGKYDGSLQWPLGEVQTTAKNNHAIAELLKTTLQNTKADYFLFWDEKFGVPEEEAIKRTVKCRGHLWHAGLKQGMNGLPNALNFVSPTWVFNKDPDLENEATSWRLSLEACLVETNVLRKMGFIRTEFKSLEGASLEWGHRLICRGIILRYVPWLIPNRQKEFQQSIPYEDELRFVLYRFGSFWVKWSGVRSVLSKFSSLAETLRIWKSLKTEQKPGEPDPYPYSPNPSERQNTNFRVSVLIPTLDRQLFLRKVLDQLRTQTIPPYEVIVVDQTPIGRRDLDLEEDFRDLPLKMIYLDRPGQCSSRNMGLQTSLGDYILFLDDDDEIPPTLVESHLESLHRFRADVSSGVAHEIGAGPLPPNFTYVRASDVFPTNNSMICRSVLYRSGLFDLAYERGQRADGDLGMRIYTSGALMMLNPDVSVLHHHAPSGGLRTHGARVITYASSRNYLTHRQLPSATEIYLALRYFSSKQVQEMFWLGILGTFSIRGGIFKRILKCIISTALLPDTLIQIRKRRIEAELMLKKFPQIPELTQKNAVV